MFQWSDKQKPIPVALKAHEYISCNMHWRYIRPPGSQSAGVFGGPSNAGEQPNSCPSQDEKIWGFRHASTPS